MRRIQNRFRGDGPSEGPTKGEKHVLYKKVVPKLNIENPPINEITLYLSTFEENKINLAAILNDLGELNPEDSIKLRINSPGGLLNEGKSLINAIQNTGAFVETELLSDANSMAAIMFCIGDKRVIYEGSSLLLHTFSSGYVGKGQEMEAYTKHATKNNGDFFRSHILGLTDVEIQKMMDGKDFWFNHVKMARRGIATHIIVRGLEIPVKRYLKLLKKAKKAVKKAYPKEKIKINTLAEALIYGVDALSPVAEEKQARFDETQNQLNELLGSYDHDDT